MTPATLEYVLNWFQLFGIPVAIVVFAITKWRERRDREHGTYDSLDDKYIEYLKMCMENDDLDIFDSPRAITGTMTDDKRHRESIAFSMLISIMERAYLMYADKWGSIRKRQWTGWEQYIADWCKRENFRECIGSGCTQFDKKFGAFLEEVMAKTQPKAAAKAA